MELVRDDAVALLAYTMAAADGTIAPNEEAAIEHRLLEQGIRLPPARRDELRRLATGARHGTSAFLRPVCEAIPDKRQRLEAMRLAVDVVWADTSFQGTEMAQILEVADELDLDRAETSRLLGERTA